MTTIASRELRNNTRQLLDRVAAGEHLTITVSGVPVAMLIPQSTRQKWMSRKTFITAIQPMQADAALQDEIDDLLGGESTDDLGLS